MGSLGHNPFRISMGSLIGVSVPMQRLYATIQRANSHPYSVLIVGERGTGKELVAKSIHSLSSRKHQPFISLDCGELAPTLMEAELFGYGKDAFVGALEPKTGLAQMAEGGTLFLNEIGEMPLKLQAKLFRALEDLQFSPVGSTERFPLRARVMASSKQEMGVLLATGALREDLFFRLSALRIEVAPLRNRKADVPLLASHFIESYADRRRSFPIISDAAMECLLAYSWPGNVLELERAVRWALSFASTPVIELDDLPPTVRSGMSGKFRDPAGRLSTLQGEYLAIIKALDVTSGDRTAAANLLQIPESTLDSRLQNFGL
jgi:transcriptional regulator with PAS, ATPase and Fis domain